jgi:hypothetical protein
MSEEYIIEARVKFLSSPKNGKQRLTVEEKSGKRTTFSVFTTYIPDGIKVLNIYQGLNF